jgi:hypothetical protein
MRDPGFAGHVRMPMVLVTRHGIPAPRIPIEAILIRTNSVDEADQIMAEVNAAVAQEQTDDT